MLRSFTIVFYWYVGLLIPQLANAASFDTSTSLEMQWAIDTSGFDNQAVQLNVKPEGKVDLNNGNKLTVIGQLFVETNAGLKPDDVDRDSYSSISRPLLIGDSAELELREFYFETSTGKNYITIGKQQVVWGKADGLKVLDVVNPQSFREFILDDFEDSRIPLWMMSYEWQIDNDSSLQLLWIPDQTMHALPNANATYAFSSPRLVPIAPSGIAVEVSPVNRPSRIFTDSDIGFRWSAFIGGWDLSLNYLYHYYDLPVYYQRLSVTPEGPKVFIQPEYERSHLTGGTFSNSFGDLTLRGELGYSTDRFYLTSNISDKDGIVKSDEFSYVLGFDWFGYKDTLLSFQFFQSIVLDSPTGLTRPSVDTTLTFLVQKEFFNDTLKAEILVLQNLKDNDGLIRPKMNYEWIDDFKVWVGADIFHGERKGVFGQFNANDRIVFGLDVVL